MIDKIAEWIYTKLRNLPGLPAFRPPVYERILRLKEIEYLILNVLIVRTESVLKIDDRLQKKYPGFSRSVFFDTVSNLEYRGFIENRSSSDTTKQNISSDGIQYYLKLLKSSELSKLLESMKRT